jgi:hypothetical protein
MYNKMTSEKCHNVISFKISLENHRGKIDAPNIHLHDRSLSWLNWYRHFNKN